MRFALIAFLVASCLVPVRAAAQTKAATAPTTAPIYLEQFDRGYSTLIVIPDPLPNVGRVLTHPPLQRLWNQGKLTSFIRREQKVALPNLHAVWFMVLQNQRWVPGEIVFGMRDSTMQSFGQLFEFMYVSELLSAALELEAQEEIPQLQRELLATLRQFEMPTLRVWVRLRDDADADALFEMVAENAPALLADSPLTVEVDERAVRVRFDAGTYFAEPEMRLIFLESMGWISGEDDPNGAALAEALANVATSAVLERRGGGLRLTIGDSPAAEPIMPHDLGPLFSADDRTIAFMTWDIRKLVDGSAEWVRLLDAWQDTPVGEAAATADEQDLFGDMRSMARQLRQIGALGAMRAWSGEDRIVFRAQQADPPAAPALADSPVKRFIPAGAEAFAIDTVSTLSERVSGTFSDFEGRLAIQEMKSVNRPERAAQIKRIIDAYYGPFDPLRQFVLHESLDWFRPGFGWVLGTGGTITRLDVRWKDEAPVTLNNLPVPEFALLGVPMDASRGGDYFRRFYDHFVAGLIRAIADGRGDAPPAGVDPKERTHVKAIDLGLGVATFGFDGAWIYELDDKEVNQRLTITIEGDMRPHYFMRDGVLVFSTSPRLSKRLLAASRVAPLTLPAQDDADPTDGPGTLVGFGHLSGGVFKAYFDIVGTWMTTVSSRPRPATAASRPQPARAGAKGPATRPFDATEFVTVFEGLGEFVGLVQTVDWRSHQSADKRDTHGEVLFAK